MLWSNTSVRLAGALHLILQPISPRRQRAHDCVDTWCSSTLKKAALKLDQMTGSELVCCHETPYFARPFIVQPILWRHWEGRVHPLAAFRMARKGRQTHARMRDRLARLLNYKAD